jgi:Putative transmembrane family 234
MITSAELSLTVPITNSLAFLFTVLGEWFVEGKSISKGTSHPLRSAQPFFGFLTVGSETWVGIAFVLAGITVCVHSKASGN